MPQSSPSATTIACRMCDLLMELPELSHGQRVRCCRCHTVITDYSRHTFQTCCAFACAAVVLLLCTLSFNVIEINVRGQTNALSLLDSAVHLFETGHSLLGLLVLFCIVLVPAALLLVLVTLCTGLMLGVKHRAWLWLGRAYYYMREWNMIEVYLLGLMVSLTRLMSLAEVSFGLSFWALVGFCLCFLAAAYSLDRHQLWHRIRELGT